MDEDKTRELGLMMQGGVRSAKTKQFGPFAFSRVEFPSQTSYSLHINFESFGFTLATWVAPPSDGGLGKRVEQ